MISISRVVELGDDNQMKVTLITVKKGRTG